TNRRLRIQPLLSPDNYHELVDDVIRNARTSILFQNQSFNLLGRNGDFSANDDDFLNLFTILRDKQRAGLDVRIIMRDSREFGRDAAASQQVLLERLQDFGFDMDGVRVQNGCHTKGIVVDSSVAVLGSHNWTNQGVLANRDASLIVNEPE